MLAPARCRQHSAVHGEPLSIFAYIETMNCWPPLRRTESADKSDALQTLRALRRRPAVAKRLECVRLQRRFPKAGCDSIARQVHGKPPFGFFRMHWDHELKMRNLFICKQGIERFMQSASSTARGRSPSARPASIQAATSNRKVVGAFGSRASQREWSHPARADSGLLRCHRPRVPPVKDFSFRVLRL